MDINIDTIQQGYENTILCIHKSLPDRLKKITSYKADTSADIT